MIGLYTPTLSGTLNIGTAHTTAQDVEWLTCGGAGWLDVCSLVRPGNSIEVNRNLAVQRAAAAGCRYIRMLDSDTHAPWGQSLLAQLFEALEDHDAVAAGAVVPVHGGKHGKLNVYPVSDEPVYQPQYVSAAAMLIDIHALARLPWPAKTPWFAREYNATMTLCTLDEGYFFSQQVRRAGGIIVACNVAIQHGADVRLAGRHRDADLSPADTTATAAVEAGEECNG